MKLNIEVIGSVCVFLIGAYFIYMKYMKFENYMQSPPSVYNRLNNTPVQAAFRSPQDFADYAIDTGDKLLPLEYARTDFYKDIRKIEYGLSFDELSETYHGNVFHKNILKVAGYTGAFNDGKLRADAINSGDIRLYNELMDTPTDDHKISPSARPTINELFPSANAEIGGLYWAGYFDNSAGQ